MKMHLGKLQTAKSDYKHSRLNRTFYSPSLCTVQQYRDVTWRLQRCALADQLSRATSANCEATSSSSGVSEGAHSSTKRQLWSKTRYACALLFLVYVSSASCLRDKETSVIKTVKKKNQCAAPMAPKVALLSVKRMMLQRFLFFVFKFATFL